MHLFRTLFMVVLTLALISSGFASPTTLDGTSNTEINTGATNYQADEDSYLRDVIKPAHDANQLTPEMAAILQQHVARLENNNVPPRRDRGSEPDDAGYSFRDDDEDFVPDFDWRDISEDGQQLEPGDDWNSGPLAFEFAFEWYGEEYNSVNVNSNGWLSLNPDDRQNNISLPECPDGGAPNPAFCVINYDLDPRNGGALYFWTNGEDEAIVSYVDYPNYGNNDITTTCQIIFSGDGSVIYQYAELNGHNGAAANVGYESPNGEMGASISYREGDYLQDGRVIRIANQWIQFENDPGIMVDPEVVEFGQVYLDEQSTMEVEVTNVGAEDLTITAISADGDAFATAGLEEDLVIGSGDAVMVEVTFTAAGEQDFEGSLNIESNAVNAEDGMTMVPLFGEGVTPPEISIDPQAIESDLFTGEMSEHVVTITNDGGENWAFSTDAEIIEDDEEGNVRNGRGGPNRDDPPDGAFAIFQDQGAWGFYNNWFAQRIEDIDVTNHNNAGDLVDVDLGAYDCMWVATGEQSANFINTWNENVERFNEWVDAGGVIFIEQGWNGNHVAEGIGGLVDQRTPQEGRLAPGLGDGGDVENWLVDQMGWAENQNFPGGSTFHSVYPEDRLEDIDGSDFFQAIAVGANTGDPGVVWYNFGRGNVIASGSPVGHQWVNHNVEGRWGNCAPVLCEWMANVLASAGWLTYEPAEGVVEGNSQLEIMITLSAFGLEEGMYEADLHILSDNDFDEVVNIVLNVTGAPDIAIEWGEEIGFDDENPENSVVDWNAAYPNLFNGFGYDISLMIDNVGVEALTIDAISFEGDAGFSVTPDEFEPIGAGESVEITVSLESEESGMHEAVMTIASDDPDEAEFSVALMGETGDPPIIEFDPNALEPELFTGQVEEFVISVSNSGQAPLRYEVEVEIISEAGDERDAGQRNVRRTDGAVGPNRDDFGDEIAQFNWGQAGANRYKAGIAWDSDQDMMWITSYSPNWIGLVDPSNDYEVVFEFQPQGTNPMGAAWREGVLYTVPWANNFLSTWDAEGNALGNLNFPTRPTAVSYSAEGGFFVIIADMGWEMQMYSFDGENLEQIAASAVDAGQFGGRSPRSVLWVDGHPDGNIWINAGTNIYQVEVNDDLELGEVVQQMQWEGNQDWDGIGHDGENLWLGGYNLNEYLIIDDGITEMNWISVLPEAGDIDGGGEEDVFVTINAFGLIEGDYEADVVFMSNDPDDPQAAVNVLVHIQGASDIIVEWDEDAGYVNPDDGDGAVVDFNMAHPDVFNGFPYGVPVWITNVGTEDLTVDNFSIEGEGAAMFSTDPEAFEAIAAGETAEVMVIFESAESGDFAAVMTINSNDPDAGAYDVDLMASSGEPPLLTLDPQAIEEDMITGEIIEHEVIVGNEGEAQLRFVVESEIISEPGDERDQERRSVRSVSPVRELANANLNLSTASRMPNSQNAEAVEAYMLENPLLDDPSRDPLPDDPPGSVYALVTAANPWGYDLNRVFDQVEELEWERFQNVDEDFDYDAFDCIWFGNYNSDAWTNNYNDNLEAIEDWVDGGGAYYSCSGTNNWGAAPVHPGGLIRQAQQYNNTGVTVVPPEECYMFELMEWDEGQAMQGNSFHHSVYEADAVEAIENMGEFQYLIDNPNGQHAVLRYSYGGGHCIVSGSTDGFLHNNPGAYIWGAAGGALLYYLDFLANSSQWLAFEPEEGTLEAGAEESIIVTLDATGLFGGEYIAELHFLSNDPADPDQVVDVTINVTGAPDINPVWDEAFGYDEEDQEASHIDFNAAFPDLYIGFDYDVIVTIENVGTDDLDIASIVFSDNDAGVWSAPEEFEVLAGGEELDVPFTFNSEERGESASVATITSNDPDEETYDIAVMAIAYLPPVLTTDPDAIEVDLITGEMVEETITIANEGDAELRWTAEVEIIAEPGDERDAGQRNVRRTDGSNSPHRDDAGDLLGEFDGINAANQYSSAAGWDWDNERMWITNYSSATAAAYSHDGNYDEFNEEIRINPGNCMDGAWADGLFFLPPWANPTVNRYNADGENIGAMQFPWGVYGMGADVEEGLLFVLEAGGQNPIHVYPLDGEGGIGDEIGVINNHFQFHANSNAWNMDWVGAHPDGQLWMSHNQNRAYQISVDTDEWTCIEGVQDFPAGGIGQPYCGVAHDGNNLWASGYTASNIRVYDDGITELRWVAIDPVEGSMDGGAETDIFVTLDATGLFGGDYEADIIFFSNDPENPTLAVNVLMHITPAPDINADWDEAAGYVDPEDGDGAVVDFNMAFDPDLFAGGAYGIPVWVSNEGTDDLQINEVSSDNDAFTTNWNEDQDVFSPGEGFEMMVTYEVAAGESGEYQGVITINSNDEDEENYEILVSANSSEPPQMVLDPEFYTIPEDDRIRTGEQVEFVITILNDGEATLNWWAESEILQEPGDEERDAGQRSVRRADGAVGPNRDDFGDAIAEFGWGHANANQYKAGIAWDSDNEYMWLTTYSPNWIGIVDPSNDFEEVNAFQPQGTNPMGAAWREGVLYTVPWANNFLSSWDIEGNALGNINFPTRPTAVSYSAEGDFFVIITDVGGWRFMFYSFDGENLEEIAVTAFNPFDGRSPRSICWVDGHPDANIWINAGTNIYQLEVNGDLEVGGVVQRMQWQGNQDWDGIGHDGENLWLGGYNLGQYLIIDDGLAELRWLTVEPSEGAGPDDGDNETPGVEPGGESEVIVLLDATGLLGGEYLADIIFYSNDPDDGVEGIVFPIEMWVEGVPDIDPIWSEEGGYAVTEDGDGDPDNWLINFNGVHPEVYNGGDYVVWVEVTNVGTDDLQINDVFTNNDNVTTDWNEEDDVFGPAESFTLGVILNAAEPGDLAEDAMLTISSNDFDEEDIMIPLVAEISLAPVLGVDPQEISSDLNTGDTEEFVLTVSNLGDEGAADLWWSTDAEIISEPGDEERDRAGRNVRSTTPVRELANANLNLSTATRMPNSQNAEAVEAYMRENPLLDNPSRDPLPDGPPGSVYALVTAANPWGYDLNRVFDQVEELEWERFQNVDEDFDYDAFDCIWFGNYNSDAWTNNYNDNLEAIEDWVDGGGAYYSCSGTNNWGAAPVHPGGLIRQAQQYNNTGVTVVPPEECYMFELMEWDEGQAMQGNSFHHSVYEADAVEAIENMGEFQYLIDNPNGQHAVLRYSYGGGHCIVSGSTDGFLHNNPGAYIWGAAGGALLYYLDYLANVTNWLLWEPGSSSDEGQNDIPVGGDDVEVIVLLDATGLLGGDYEAELYFYSNDPTAPNDEADITVAINLTVTGVPNIRVTPGGPEEDNTIVDFGIGYFGYEYMQDVMVENVGTDDLQVFDVITDDDYPDFFVNPDDLEDFILAPGEEAALTIYWTPDPEHGEGDVGATLMVESNDPRFEEELYPIAIGGGSAALEAPILVLDPTLIILEMDDNEQQEVTVNVSNEGGSLLIWAAEFEVTHDPGDDEERDQGAARQVRSIFDNASDKASNGVNLNDAEVQVGPRRDDPPDGAFAIFQDQGAWGFYNNWFAQRIEDIDVTNHNNAGDLVDVDLGAYDCMWVATGEQSANFINTWNENVERFNEWVDAGGVIFIEQGWNGNHVAEGIGGLVDQRTPQEGRLAPGLGDGGDVENWLVDQMGWAENQNFPGGSTFHSVYPEDRLEDIDGSDFFQAIAVGANTGDPGVVWYNFGRGNVIASGSPVGHQWVNHNVEGRWGNCAPTLCYWMADVLATPSWLTYEPEGGQLDSGGDVDISILLSTEGLVGGLYEGTLTFLSNDPRPIDGEDPYNVVTIQIEVSGVGVAYGDPVPRPYEGAEAIQFPEIFVNNRVGIMVEIINLGTLAFEITGVEVEAEDGDDWATDIEDGTMVPALGSITRTLLYTPNNAGEHNGTIWIVTSADEPENGTIAWDVSANAVTGPMMSVDPEELGNVAGFEGDPVESVMVISNAEGERANLTFSITTEEVEIEERDAGQRNVRRTGAAVGPNRDDIDLDGMMFCSFQTNSVWGWLDDGMRRDNLLNNDNLVSYRNANDWDDVDFSEYDVVIVSSYNQQFNQQYSENLERFEEYVAGGGAAYFETGNSNQAIRSPGGIWNDVNGNAQNGALVVSPDPEDDNYSRFAEICHAENDNFWEEDEPIEGNSWLHSFYSHEQFEEGVQEGELAWYQVIASRQGQPNDWGCVAYGYGGGTVMTVGHPSAHCWFNYAQEGMWGSIAAEILFYLATEGGISWLSVDPTESPEGGLEAGASAEIDLIYDPTDLEEGNYLGLLTIESNDPENPELVLDVLFIVGDVETVHFTEFEETDASHVLTVVEAMFDNGDIGNGWEIGVFDADGNLGGAGVWNGQALDIEAFASAEGVDQFEGNEGFTFIFWNPREGEDGTEYDASPEWLEGPEVWNAGSASTLSLSGGPEETIVVALEDGWNLMSINVMLDPDEWMHQGEEPGPDVPAMFAAFADMNEDGDHRVILLKNGNGAFWRPDFGFNNIPYWDYTQGYQIKLTGGSDIEWDGMPIDAQMDVPMETGWNMIGYLPGYMLDASAGADFYVLSPIIDRVFLAKDGAGRFMRPEFNFSNMIPWREGFGYQVKLNEDGDDEIAFNYPEAMDEGAYVGAEASNGSHWTSPRASDANMSVLITEFNGIELGEGDQIAAFSTSGMQIGLGTITDGRSGIAVWADEDKTELVEGAAQGEAFTLKLWDADKSVEHILEVSTINFGKGLVYETNSFVALEVTVQSLVPDVYSLSQNFPNPFNSITKLSFGLPENSEVSISVFDISGRLVTTLVNGQLTAGNHVIAWNAQGKAAGLYLVKMETLGGFTAVRKVVLTK